MDLLNESTGMANQSMQIEEELSLLDSSDDSRLNRSGESYSAKKRKTKDKGYNITVNDELFLGKISLNTSSSKEKLMSRTDSNPVFD